MWKQGCHFLLSTLNTKAQMSSCMNCINYEINILWWWMHVYGGGAQIGHINSNHSIAFPIVGPYFFICLFVSLLDSNDCPTFARVVLHPGLTKRCICGGLHTQFHNHKHTHTHHRVVEGEKKHTVRFGPFWPQSGLMGILWLSAPHSTQSQDVWPPSERIPAGKMNYSERKSRAILLGMKWGQRDGGWKRNSIILEIKTCFPLYLWDTRV